MVDNGLSALDILKQENTYQIIISDYKMPEMNGIELITRIRQIEKYAEIPILLLTSIGKNTDIHNLEKSGSVWTLTKPVKLKELHNAVMTAMGKVKSITDQEKDNNSTHDKYIEKLDEMLKHKEEEIMEV